MAVHYVAGVQWNDLTIILPLAVASFAASSAASRLINFSLRNTKPLGSNALVVGASSYEDLCERIGKRALVRPMGYLFTGSDGELLFRNEKGEVGPSTVDDVLDDHVIEG